MKISFRDCKHKIVQKSKNFSQEEHVLIKLRSCIDIILYPLIKFPEIVKDWNATDAFAFEDVIVWLMLNKLKWKPSKLLFIYLCNH